MTVAHHVTWSMTVRDLEICYSVVAKDRAHVSEQSLWIIDVLNHVIAGHYVEAFAEVIQLVSTHCVLDQKRHIELVVPQITARQVYQHFINVDTYDLRPFLSKRDEKPAISAANIEITFSGELRATLEKPRCFAPTV